MTTVKEELERMDTAMREEIERLNTEHWNGIIHLASKAECADDLNEIVHRLSELYECIHGGYPNGFSGPVVYDALFQIEEVVTQWQNIRSEFDETEWGVQLFEMSEECKIFIKNKNTVIMWDDCDGNYREYNRHDETEVV